MNDFGTLTTRAIASEVALGLRPTTGAGVHGRRVEGGLAQVWGDTLDCQGTADLRSTDLLGRLVQTATGL